MLSSMSSSRSACFTTDELVGRVVDDEVARQADRRAPRGAAAARTARGTSRSTCRLQSRRRAAPRRAARISSAALLVKVTASTSSGVRVAVADEVGDAVRDDARLAGPGAGEDQQRPVDVQHGLALFGVERSRKIHGDSRQLTADAQATQVSRRGSTSGRANSPTGAIVPPRSPACVSCYSTVTLFARLRGWSTSQPRRTAMWYASSCSGTT